MTKPFISRKKILLNPRFQLHFLGITIGLSLLVNMVFFGAISQFFSKFRQKGFGFGLDPWTGNPFLFFVQDQERAMLFIFLGSSAISVLILLVGGLYLSHRVAGPIYRLKNEIDKHADNLTLLDTAQVDFRKKDYFHELADSYNRLLVNLRNSKR